MKSIGVILALGLIVWAGVQIAVKWEEWFSEWKGD